MSQSSSASCCDSGHLEFSDESDLQTYQVADGIPLPFGFIVDRWRLIATLGRGGFSCCYLAEDQQQTHLPLVALKIGGILGSKDEHDWSWTNFHQELHMFRRLCVGDSGLHATCVPQIFGWGILESTDGQRPWICMERLGQDLYSETWYIAKERHELEGLDRQAARWPGKGYSEPCLLQYALVMLRALQHVHRQNIVHRDVKPANFCLPHSGELVGKRRDQPASKVYLIDFGLSHDVPLKEGHEPFFGTPDYASSACLHEKKAFPKDDLESLVYTLLEMWNGELPWDLEADIDIKGNEDELHGWTSQQLRDMSKARQRRWDKLLLQDLLPPWILWLDRYIKALSSIDPVSYEYCAMMLNAFREIQDPHDPEE
ncbi:hypothetical protein WJX74_004935 [Apatococcus lobatus]|uniref:non-specific serine/threonine protein kinase n=1 Tax=Apatococcus lobatus TaxID=904363 RepID=A0AAW1QXZ4_9CHLO